MPYIVTTKTPVRLAEDKGDELGRQHVSRRAFATPDDPGIYPVLREAGIPRADLVGERIARLPDEGGTIGPLPDGTVIEAQPVDDAELRRACPLILTSDWLRLSEAEKCEAYNAAQPSPQEPNR